MISPSPSKLGDITVILSYIIYKIKEYQPIRKTWNAILNRLD